ncbi:uncharacterized protein PFL1_00758 [Pseudozyma flocculosa PF-1]|uniref:Related to Cullin-3 n=1 Tax=Pseudozyma flocculosa TaxID=84751 RepID=A0A5C3F481_9BASI|nr:uncharacterized protein PFL1_00758 [Pseudozyma flocculosa PF-1]EPQ31423.1 hypothetical protein PFL1_00758 [Pseudozyma flocculosa PF-1]SPO38795.1 related to Cullin-3 [Pseudozyma flocculosa]
MSGAGSARRPGARGIKLKPPKKIGNSVPIEEMWKRLVDAIGEIHNHNISKLSYEEHYRYAYNLVLYQHGDMLYNGVKRQIEAHLNKQCRDKIAPAFPPGGATAVSAGIVLPESLLRPQPSSSSSSSSGPASSKGKGREAPDDAASRSANSDGGDHDVGAQASTAVSMSATQPGDRADAIARIQAGERLMTAIRDTWLDHRSCMSTLSDILKYADRVYVPQAGVPSTNKLGLELFRDTVVRSAKFPIQIHLYSTLLTHIQIEREGFVISRSLVKANIDMLGDLTHVKRGVPAAQHPSVYTHDFEPAFLSTSAAFYKAEAERLLDASDAARYLAHVDRRLQEEVSRVSVYLKPETQQPLQRLLEKHFLANHLTTIVDMPGSGLVAMLDEDRRDDLAIMYRLFQRVKEGPQVLRMGLKSYIGTKGRLINEAVSASAQAAAAGPTTAQAPGETDTPAGDADGGAAPSGSKDKAKGKGREAAGPASDASTPQAAMALRWVEEVLEFKNKFDAILASSYQNDAGCETSINEAFESFVNTNPRAPEFISLFIDENLKKGLKGKTEEEVDEVLNKTISVFRFLHEKDVFERYYKQHLAKRMLQGRSVSDDAERGMMAKLKIECGHGYVQKLQGMLNDMKVSEDTNLEFAKNVRNSSRPLPFEMSVNVLTSTYWPISAQAQPCTMPASMMEVRRRFEAFYQSKHSGRILTWHPNLGNADVRVSFKARKHELNVSTYALIVLLLFEDVADGQSLGYEDLAASTNIPDADLQRTLQSLACAKYKILLKEPKGREINRSDRFTFNHSFSCPLARIKIAQVAARVESAGERKETTEKVEEERKNMVEACIVRVMKDRKTMTHNELVSEVVRQLAARFQPNLSMVKKRIESLLDREYLERAETRNVYNYLA